MKKVKVLKSFRDIDDFTKVHEEGSIMEAESLRASNLVKLGLAEYVDGNDINELFSDQGKPAVEKKARKPRTPRK